MRTMVRKGIKSPGEFWIVLWGKIRGNRWECQCKVAPWYFTKKARIISSPFASALQSVIPKLPLALPPVGVQLLLSQPDRLWRYLHQLVLVDEFQRLLQGKVARRCQLDGVVGAGGADVGQLLPLAGVDVQVVVLGVLADDHPAVDLHAGADEEDTARLQGIQGVGGGLAVLHGHQHAVLAAGNLSLVRRVVMEGWGEDAGAAGLGQHLAAQADQAARRNDELEADGLAHGAHGNHFPFARTHLFDNNPLVLGRYVHHQVFHRLQLLAVFFAVDHLRLGNCHLKPFPAHVLDQDGEMQLAAAGNLEGVGAGGILDAERDVGAQFLVEPFADVARGDQLPFPTGKRGVVDDEIHGNGRLVDGNVGEGDRVFRAGQGLADTHLVETGYGDDVAGAPFGHIHLLQPFVAKKLGDPPLYDAAIALDMGDGLAGGYLAVEHLAGGDPADIVVVIDIGDQHLERCIRVVAGGADVRLDHREERLHAAGGGIHVEHGVAQLGAGVDDGEVQLFIGGVQFAKEVEHHVNHLAGAGAGAVDLVDHHDRLEPQVEGFLQDEPGLRHGAVEGVHQEEHRVDHLQDPLHLAAKVGVARGVDDVDLVAAVVDRQVFGKDGDPPLLFQVVGVHDPLGDGLVFPEYPGMAQHGVHQGGLAMVDVGDYGDIAN